MPDLLGLRRQDYPRGTPEGGSYVQTPDGQSLSTIESHPDWHSNETLTISSTAIQLSMPFRTNSNYEGRYQRS